MNEIISENQVTDIVCVPSNNETAIVDTSKESKDIVPVEKKKEVKQKNPKGLAIASLVLAILSIPCAISGFIPFQILFLTISLIFYMIDRNVNGKRGLSLFSMICTIVTFVVIFITLTYCIILFSFGMYTAFINDAPYNFIIDTIKSVISFVAGIFNININF